MIARKSFVWAGIGLIGAGLAWAVVFPTALNLFPHLEGALGLSPRAVAAFWIVPTLCLFCTGWLLIYVRFIVGAAPTSGILTMPRRFWVVIGVLMALTLPASIRAVFFRPWQSDFAHWFSLYSMIICAALPLAFAYRRWRSGPDAYREFQQRVATADKRRHLWLAVWIVIGIILVVIFNVVPPH